MWTAREASLTLVLHSYILYMIVKWLTATVTLFADWFYEWKTVFRICLYSG